MILLLAVLLAGAPVPGAVPSRLPFDDARAMRDLFGVYDPADRTSTTDDFEASVALSRSYEEDGATWNVLVVGKRGIAGGEVQDSHGSTGWNDVHLYRLALGRWVLASSSLEVASGGSNGNYATAKFLELGPDRHGLSMGGGGCWQGYCVLVERLFSLEGGSVQLLTPTILSGAAEEIDRESACVRGDVENTYRFVPGANPKWYDLVLTEHCEPGKRGGDDDDAPSGARAVPAEVPDRTERRVRALGGYVPAVRTQPGPLTLWTGTVGGSATRLALLTLPPRNSELVGYFAHAKGGALVRGSPKTLQEYEGGRHSGTFLAGVSGDRFEGSWRRPGRKTAVPFSFRRAPDTPGAVVAGRFRAAGATIVIAVEADGRRVAVSGSGPDALPGGTLRGSYAVEKGSFAYDDGTCKLQIALHGEALVVQQLTPTCGETGRSFDFVEVGPFLRVGE